MIYIIALCFDTFCMFIVEQWGAEILLACTAGVRMLHQMTAQMLGKCIRTSRLQLTAVTHECISPLFILCIIQPPGDVIVTLSVSRMPHSDVMMFEQMQEVAA